MKELLNPKNSIVRSLINYKSLLYVFFSLLLIYICSTLYNYTINNNGWILGDWLINFQDGGFKRRGLSGSFFFILQDLTGLKLQYLVFSFQLAMYSFFFVLLNLIIYKKKIDFKFILLVLSPLSFMFYINEPIITGRKEVLFFSLFSYFIYLLSNNQLGENKKKLIQLLICVIILFHEVVFFYIPYFLISLYWYSDKKWNYRSYIPFVLPPVILITILFFLGADINSGNSISILMNRGVSGNISNGILSSNTKSIEYLLERIQTYRYYIIIIIYMFLHIFLFIKSNFEEFLKIFKWFLLAVIFTLPLFLLALDWGRWLHIHFMAIIIMISGKLNTSTDYSFSVIKFNKTLIYNMLILTFLLTWKLRHCCNTIISKSVGVKMIQNVIDKL